MTRKLLPFLPCLIGMAHVQAQGPEVTSWIINPGSETGYSNYLTNVQAVNYTATDVFVSCNCIPGYDIGPWTNNPNVPVPQDFSFRITRNPVENTGTDVETGLGHIGVWRNGVSIFNAEDGMSYNNQGIWHRDARVFEGISFDLCLGHPAPNGEYHHHVSPSCLYDFMDDQAHGDLIGYAFDGFPIYGAWGFANTDGTGGISRMRTSYQLRSITDRTTLPDGTALPANQYGPALGGQYPLGAFIEDYAYVAGSGDLDEHNGRFTLTPEYPNGTYAYFVTLDALLQPEFPYVIGTTYYGTVAPGNTGPGSGHNAIPGGAVLYNPGTGMAEVSGDPLQLYPIPALTELNIRTDGTAVRSVDLIDATGRIVVSTIHQGSLARVSLNGIAPGFWTARITLTDDRVVLRPFVKQL
jgi:hypothetical protein